MGADIGYFLTWHTHGTWLHGDSAGSVDKNTNTFGTPRLGLDPKRFERELKSMRHEPLVLSQQARDMVDKVMRRHCVIRNWNLRALAVRTNHVHVVVASPQVEPEKIVKQLKEWGTRELRANGMIGNRELAWADHASTIYLFGLGDVEAKVRYVNEMQDEVPEGHGRKDWKAAYGLSRRADETPP